MRWTVILGGDLGALEYLAENAEQFSEPGWTISMRNDVLHVEEGVTRSESGELYCLTSPELDALNDDDAVKVRASSWLDQWSGAASLVAGIVEPVRVQQITDRDEHGGQSATLSFCFRVLPAETPERKEALKQVLQLCEEPDVKQLLGLCGKGPMNWVDAYRVFEVIENACGGIVAKGWASKREINCFKHTANHPKAIGDCARHGVLKTDPPAKPMSREEASALMTRIIKSFLDDKMQSAHGG